MSPPEASSKWTPAQAVPRPSAPEPTPCASPCPRCDHSLPAGALCPPGTRGGRPGLPGPALPHRHRIHLPGNAPRGPPPASPGLERARLQRVVRPEGPFCSRSPVFTGKAASEPPTLCQAPGWTVTREVNQMVPALGIHSLGPHNGYRLQGWSLGTRRAEGKSL